MQIGEVIERDGVKMVVNELIGKIVKCLYFEKLDNGEWGELREVTFQNPTLN